MKITDVEAIPIHAPFNEVYWGNQSWGHNKSSDISAPGLPPGDDRSNFPYFWRSRAAYSQTVDTTLVKISTDAGIVGWGEAKSPVAPEITATAIRNLASGLLIGEDPTDPLVHWDRLYGAMRIRGGSHGFWMDSISGIDTALWDITGKAHGLPLCKLLGGSFRDRIRVYASGIPGVRSDAPPEAWERLRVIANDVRERGFEGTKMGIGLGVEGDIRSVQIVRETLGNDFTIFVDAAGMYGLSDALRLGRALEPLNVGWLEAPVPPEDFELSAVLTQSLSIPIASDQVFNRWQARDLMLKNSIDVIQPDVCRTGGVSECKRIADIADTFGKAATPHVSIGSAIQFAASVHLAAATPNQTWMEYWYGSNPLGNVIIHEPFHVDKGYFYVPEGPGLGIEVNEEQLQRFVA